MNSKIDMVYLWCDGNDPDFKARKDEYMGIPCASIAENVSGNVRFFDNDELKYALRSLEKYAPWINHVYIVTDRQVPKWLNVDYGKVTVVDHSQIMPQECIPCFNSATIEQFLPFIPNLNEKFLYANDDMFFSDAVEPEDFFLGEKTIVRVEQRGFMMKWKRRFSRLLGTYDKKGYTYNGTILNSIDLLERDYGKGEVYSAYHNIDSYTKTAFIATLKRFAKEFKECESFRFRAPKTLQRVIFGLDAVYSGQAVMEIINPNNTLKKMLGIKCKAELFGYYGKEANLSQVIEHMRKYSPKVFCLQAADGLDFEVKRKSKQFLEEMFQEKSRFEK